jgi:hypothetical protein
LQVCATRGELVEHLLLEQLDVCVTVVAPLREVRPRPAPVTLVDVAQDRLAGEGDQSAPAILLHLGA